MATAMETYDVEWNSYTLHNLGAENPRIDGALSGFRQLTTPVAYITSIPVGTGEIYRCGGTRAGTRVMDQFFRGGQ